MSDDVLSLPYGFINLDPHDEVLDHDEKVTNYPIAVFFTTARDRKRFATAIKKAMKKRGEWRVDHLRP